MKQQKKQTNKPAPAKVLKKTNNATPNWDSNISPQVFSYLVTGVFFLVALLGITHHEMWRDEHQAFLVARDAHSLPQLLQNMRYEGNPALWHLLLFFITCFTHNPVYMQGLHLLIACGFVYVFNRYSTVGMVTKILFSFSYFALYEYAVISRSYGLGVLLIFIACALFKHRSRNYLLIGIVLALLCNVTIYAVVIAAGIAGILVLDYIFYQAKSRELTLKLIGGGVLLLIGILASIYQILPDKNNGFPAFYATEFFEMPRWGTVASRIFVSYFYIPNTDSIHFWNTNHYFPEYPTLSLPFWGWLSENKAYLWGWYYMPVILFITASIIFMRKPLICLLYMGVTTILLAVFYYTDLIHMRYCGYLFIVLVSCYWLAGYYPEKTFKNTFLNTLSNIGKRISIPFLVLVLSTNVIGAMAAYNFDLNNKFSVSKDAADYIHQNKLDTLKIVGVTDFTLAPLTSYLDNKIYYSQMHAYGSYCVWSKQRNATITFKDLAESVLDLMGKERHEVLMISTNLQKFSMDGGKTNVPLTRAMISPDVKIDMIQSFEGGIMADECYYLYKVQPADTLRDDLHDYIRLH